MKLGKRSVPEALFKKARSAAASAQLRNLKTSQLLSFKYSPGYAHKETLSENT